MRLGTERLNAFSDGVLAIVVTILVLDIRVPEQLSMATIPQFLREVEHDLLIYAASFWLVGIYWLVQHIITAHVRTVDLRLLLRNLLFLFSATLLPFLTKLKNAYPKDALAAQLFGLGHLACGVALIAVWRYVCAHGELRSSEPSPALRLWLGWGIGAGCAIAAVASQQPGAHQPEAVHLPVPPGSLGLRRAALSGGTGAGHLSAVSRRTRGGA